MSKFKDILNAAKDREREEEPEIQPEVEPARQPETEPPKRGRPKGKRSDPDYEQVTAYIRKETYRKIKIALIQQAGEQDFSELVEKLLTEFLSTQKSESSDI